MNALDLPHPSARLGAINGDAGDGWEILSTARAAKAAGRDVVDLTIGDHDRTTPAPILDALEASARGGHTGYASVPGIDALRAAIAARVTARTGVATTAENVLVTAGGQAALFAAATGVADPGDTLLYIDPYYATYPGTIRGAAARAVPVTARAADGFQPTPHALEAAPPARGLLINTPNNPTGVVYTEETLEQIAAFARARNLWVIADEVYDGQVWSGQHLSPRALPGMARRTLVVGSFSKSHIMTGSRIGWLIGPAPMIAQLSDLLTVTTYGVPGYIQDAALAALTDGAALEREVAETYRRRRDLALATLSGASGLSLVQPDGAMYVMVDIRATGLDGRSFAEALMQAHAVAVMPGESFGHAAAGHVRIALTADDARLTKALDKLKTFAAGLAA